MTLGVRLEEILFIAFLGFYTEYEVGELYLIGSALYKEPEEANDYDFAVRNVLEGNFFEFYGELWMRKTTSSHTAPSCINLLFLQDAVASKQMEMIVQVNAKAHIYRNNAESLPHFWPATAT